MMKLRLTAEQIERVVDLRRQGNTYPEIRKETGMSLERISYYCKEAGLPMGRLTQWGRRESAFANLDDPEAAYWFGFVLADGCLSGNSLIVELAPKDVAHVESLRSWLSPSSSIGRGAYDEPTRLVVTSSQIASDLRRHGIQGAKSYADSQPIPDSVKESPRFWRGVFDGDGSISIDHKPCARLCGHRDVVEGFREWLISLGITPWEVTPNKSIWQTGGGGSTGAAILDALQYGEGPSLARKLALARAYA